MTWATRWTTPSELLFHHALDLLQPGGHDFAAELFEHPRPEDDVGDACLILQGNEDGVAFAGTLPPQHHARPAPGRRSASPWAGCRSGSVPHRTVDAG